MSRAKTQWFLLECRCALSLECSNSCGMHFPRVQQGTVNLRVTKAISNSMFCSQSPNDMKTHLFHHGRQHCFSQLLRIHESLKYLSLENTHAINQAFFPPSWYNYIHFNAIITPALFALNGRESKE